MTLHRLHWTDNFSESFWLAVPQINMIQQEAHLNILLYTWGLKWIWLPTPCVILEEGKRREGNSKPTEKAISLCLWSAWNTPCTNCFNFIIYMHSKRWSKYGISLFHITDVCRPISSSVLRNLGRCPLTPEEAALMLAGLGVKRGTYIYLASSHIYGGKFRMHSFTNLYPNLVTKETLLTPSELAPFRNFSSQVINHSLGVFNLKIVGKFQHEQCFGTTFSLTL